MISEEKGKQLHDRASRGEELSKEETVQLEEWYALQDKMEDVSFGLEDQASTIANLQAQIEEVLAQLVKTTNRIRKISAENETLRQENANLQRQLAQLPGSPSA